MTAIRSGSRKDQLLDLRRRVDLELETFGVRRPTVVVQQAAAPPPPPTDSTDDPLVTVPLSHVNSKSIRAWAGLDAPSKGPLPHATVDAYTRAHRPGVTP